MGLEYAFSGARASRSNGVYGATSIAFVHSRRVAEWLPNCDLGAFCPPAHVRRRVNDPSAGFQLALGWASAVGAASVYGEASFLYPFARKRTDGDVYKEYWIFPLSVGVRF